MDEIRIKLPMIAGLQNCIADKEECHAVVGMSIRCSCHINLAWFEGPDDFGDIVEDGFAVYGAADPCFAV